MKFLNKIITNLLQENPDLSGFSLVLPGKRPIVFIKKILEEKQYSGFLPDFITIEDLVKEIADQQLIDGISLWLFAYENYRKLGLNNDDFAEFLKWFPTLAKDWDDILKFSDNDEQVLAYLFDEERIKNWAQNLGEQDDNPRVKFLNFWKNMTVFLPTLKKNLQEKNWATSGMIHETAKEKITAFVSKTNKHFVFCGFNAFTPVEEKLVKNFLQHDKGQTFFQTDSYYLEDEKQEAGIFLRQHKKWKEFNQHRRFNWVENDFKKPKNIQVFEISGNVSQTKVLPEILEELHTQSENDFSDTAVVLLDENLLPASLDALQSVENLNITMGFPLKNLSFSNAMKQLFHLQKQLEKRESSYYYNDLLPILEELPHLKNDAIIINDFKTLIEERNIVYISKKLLLEELSELSYFQLLQKNDHISEFLEQLISYCFQLKFDDIDDVLYENIAHFEQSFKIIRNQLKDVTFLINMETLEVLVNQLVLSEKIDFQGEPLQGLQVMGLLETRLLNFKNIILLSVNEGKLPLGNTQNTYIPFDVRHHFNLHTFLENDSIYAYHFYRLLQNSENVYLLFNALTTGVNTGEKSRFITQLELESPHEIQHKIIENTSEPIAQELIEIEKTETVIQQLEEWKSRVSATHLTSYLYNPIDFYLHKVLKTGEVQEIEEELSVKNYGNLVHYSLQAIYENLVGKLLNESILRESINAIDESINESIQQLKHQKDFYDRGMNYVHRSIAKRVIENIIKYDLELVKNGHQLKIIALEKKFENVEFYLDENQSNKISFYGFIDRIDELDGTLRIIDYKTAKTKGLQLSIDEKNIENYLISDLRKQAIQLCIYHYVVENSSEFSHLFLETSIWSFAEVAKGPVALSFKKGDLSDALVSVRQLILEILNPEIPFVENKKQEFN